MTFETFRAPSQWERDRLTCKEASCFNGEVSVKKYRVTWEEVIEPNEVIVARLRKLWTECDNHHHWNPIREAARKYGVELDMNDAGIARKKAT